MTSCEKSHHRCHRASSVGNADDAELASGVTAIMFDEPAVAAVDVRGGAPGTRETDLLDRAPHGRADRRRGAVRRLGVRARRRLRRAGVAARAGPRLRGRRRPHPDRLRRGAVRHARTAATRTGAASRPTAISAMRRRQPPAPISRSAPPARALARPRVNLKGGLGSASAVTREGHTVGALVAVNACGSANVGGQQAVLGRAVRAEREFGGHGFPAKVPAEALIPRAKGQPGENTTIAMVATDAGSPRRRPSSSP